jgi:primosomal protein N' (replication factor Y) (superfamily II helicase)
MKSPNRGRMRTPSLFGLEEDEAELPPARGFFAKVALNRPVRCEFTYAVPERLIERAREGARVAVPLGPSRKVGVIVSTAMEADVSSKRIREVFEVLDPEPVVGRDLLELTRWIARRYACSWGEALAAVLPAPLKREVGVRRILVARVAKGVGAEALAELEVRSPKQHRLLRNLLEMEGPVELRDLLRRLNLSDSPAKTLERNGLIHLDRVEAQPDLLITSSTDRPRPAQLSGPQERAIAAITAGIDEDRPTTFLLEGVTGSGKTEVYLQVIEHALARGQSAIVLVPEIALTPQTVGWFRSRFGEVAVLHSRMTDAQRLRMWMRLRKGETRVVVGARSAIFAPLDNLGVVVLDEEHEPSFKQGSVPRYHAREVAVERARRAGAVCILGSATPSLEMWHASRSGEVELLRLPERVGGGTIPTVHVVDMRLERGHGGPPIFSALLRQLLRETVGAGEQAIFFLNRRGFIPVLFCPGCKTTVHCRQCDVSMTFHRGIRKLVCHSCCEEIPVPRVCPACTRPGLRPLGAGSERIEALLAEEYPEIRVRRMDSDTMRRRQDYEDALGAFERHEVDVLVGTQMIAKGLDFPRVTLVGVLSADQALHLPDFRASERTYQLIAQVAGRAGRGKLPGRIVVQTVAPDHPAVRHAAHADFEGFVREENALRQELGYPPHGRILRVLFEDESSSRVDEAARALAERLRERFGATALSILGPAPAPISQVRGRHRQHLILKSPLEAPEFDEAREHLITLTAGIGRPRATIDVDPMSML